MDLTRFHVRLGRYKNWMIVLKRLQIFALACAVTRPLYAFSSAKPSIDRLSDAGEQAVWAHQIIKLIKNHDSYPLSQAEPTILDRIKSLNAPKTISLSSAFNNIDGRYVNKDEVVKMMTEGIILNPIVFNQQMLDSVKQKKEKVSEDKEQNVVYSGNFIFYPNYLGTSNMFHHLDQRKQLDFLLTSGFGIGKTIAIIFYIHLSNFITSYAVKCSKDPSLQKELELLKQENLLTQPFLKYFYWSADYRPGLNSLQRIVVEQTVELQENDRQELLSIKEWDDFISRIRQLYPHRIQIRPIVDQFDLIDSLMRRWNNYLLTKKRNQRHKLYEEQKKQIVELSELQKEEIKIFKARTHRRAKNLSNDLYKFTKLGTVFGLNSSLSIQKELFNAKIPPPGDIQQRVIGFQLTKKPLMIRMPYERLLKKDKGNVDGWNIVWFEIQRRLNTSTPQAFAAIRTNFLTAIKDKSIPNFFRFIYLRDYLDSIEYRISFGQQNLSISQQQFERIIQQYSKYCLSKEKQIFAKMFEKNQPWCKDLVLIMHEYSQVKAKNEQQMNKLAVFYLQIFRNIESANKINIQEKLQQIIINQAAGQPFPIHIEDGFFGFITFNWTYLQFYELTAHAIFPNVASSIFTDSSTLQKKLMLKGTVRGCALQTAIIESLTPGSILQYQLGQGLSLHMKIAERVGFIPFNSNLTINQGIQDKEKFKGHFGNLLTACFNSPDSNFLAIPQYTENGVLGTSQTSVGIDFVIGEYQSTDKKYLISTFNTTVDEDPSERVQQFNTKLFPLLSKLAKEGGYTSKDIEFQHVVPSLKRKCRTTFADSQNGFTPTIVETNVFQLEIKDSDNVQAQNALKHTLLNCNRILTERRMIKQLK